MPDKPDPLTFTLKDFERVIDLWDCKLNQSFFDPETERFVLPSTCRIVTVPDGHSIVPRCKPQGERSSHEVIVECLGQVRDELNDTGFYGPNAKQTLAMIRMFNALEAAYPQTDLLACDAEMPEFMDTFKWGLAAGVAVGLVLDDPEILEED